MSYINIDWIADEHAEYLGDNFDLTAYESATDRKMNSVAVSLRVPVPSIPVDADGYVTSLPFQEYGIVLMTMKIFSGYWGKRTGNKDIYYQKMNELKSELSSALKLLTKETITGSTETDTDTGNGFEYVTQSAY
ncbi:MAG: hypothetical protein U9N61_01640 [Euryarchaeota archaeon]|nr:hypothetical protein [Euryarchaeota archaeon]